MAVAEYGFQRIIAELHKLQDSLRAEHERAATDLKSQLLVLQQANADLAAQLKERDRLVAPSIDVPDPCAKGGLCTDGGTCDSHTRANKPLPLQPPPAATEVLGVMSAEAETPWARQPSEPQEDPDLEPLSVPWSLDEEEHTVCSEIMSCEGEELDEINRRRSERDLEDCSNVTLDLPPMLSPVYPSDRLGFRAEPPDFIRRKLLVRLGPLDEGNFVSDRVLHQAIVRIGLTKYDLNSVRRFMEALHSAKMCRRPRSNSATSSCERTSSIRDVIGSVGKAKDASKSWLGLTSRPDSLAKPIDSKDGFGRGFSWSASPLDFLGWRMSFDAFVEFFIDPELFSFLLPSTADMLQTIAEVLVAGDANRLVAELTNTVIDDLASPPPRMDVGTKLEPIGCTLIIINAILIGVQADRRMETWEGWLYIESFFVTFFCAEMLVRAATAGWKAYFFGHDWAWNNLDVSIIVMAIADLSVQASGAELTGSGTTTILRLCRLTRLSRLFRMLRFKMLRELTLMLKGLLAGLRTLGWAMVLLMTVIYAIAVILTSVVGNSEVVQVTIPNASEYFSTVPRSMFTAFRCFTSDCADTNGRSLVALLARALGWMFTLPYIVLVMLVTFGIFNLIMAIYVESTLSSAKRQDEVDARRSKNESLRIARSTKMLLKKFCAVHRTFGSHSISPLGGEASMQLYDDLEDGSLAVTKEIFLLALQDSEVQHLMDDLDIVPNRAHLFDALDANGRGVIQLTDLMHGLLKVRGDAYKSDIIACLMAVRSLQDSVQSMREEIAKWKRGGTQELLRSISRSSPSRPPSRKPTLTSSPVPPGSRKPTQNLLPTEPRSSVRLVPHLEHDESVKRIQKMIDM